MATRVTSPLFVGRQAELEVLEAALADAGAGNPNAVLVGGEAGVGKSRLLEELAHRASGTHGLTLVGHCVEVAEGELPYAPIVGALRALAAELSAAQLETVLGAARPELGRLVPQLATDEASPDDADLGQSHLFELLLGAFGRLGETRPVTLVIEDLHWADPSTRDLVRFLIRSATRERLALIATYRTDELHRRHPLRPLLGELERDPRVRRIAVAPFSRNEFSEQVAAILESLPEQSVMDRLFQRSDGNPFFTEELLAASSGTEHLPESLRDVLLVRLEGLSEPAQRAVRAAAAVGRRIDHRLLTEIAGVDEAALLDALREAVAAQVLVVAPREQAYEFRHALLREAAYDELLPGEREGLHLTIARALDARPELAGTDATLAAELAYHWHAAGELELALPASLAAGRAAERLYAHAEAQRHYERALAIWDRVPDHELDRVEVTRLAAQAAYDASDLDRAAGLARLALEGVDPAADAVRASLLEERLGRYLEEMGRAADSRRAYARALELMPQAPTAERAMVLAADARVLALGRQHDEARVRAEEAISIARRIGADRIEASGLSTLVIALLDSGRPQEALRHGQRAIELAAASGSIGEIARAYINTAETLDQSGDLEKAVALTLEGARVIAEHGGERGLGNLVIGEAVNRLVRLGRLGEAAAYAEEAMRAAARVGPGRTALHEALAAVEVARGDEVAARRDLELAKAMIETVSGEMWEGSRAALEAELNLSVGDVDAALRVVDQALAAMEEVEWPAFSAPLYAHAARAHVERAGRARALKRPAEVEQSVATVAALERRIDARAMTFGDDPPPEYAAWRAQLSAEASRLEGPGDADAWQDVRVRWDAIGFTLRSAYCALREAEGLLGSGGARARARDLLAAAHEVTSVAGARPLTNDIEELSRRARLDLAGEPARDTGPAAPTPAEEAGLTARETEVLALVAEGHTNRQIAEELFISGKTSSVHVSRILAKLGAANRGEAAAIARRLGLVAHV
jgi:DNA-binding CsgD family transcriptional regulator/tetratricopeptide (TPR) repeat protein